MDHRCRAAERESRVQVRCSSFGCRKHQGLHFIPCATAGTAETESPRVTLHSSASSKAQGVPRLSRIPNHGSPEMYHTMTNRPPKIKHTTHISPPARTESQNTNVHHLRPSLLPPVVSTLQ